MKKISLSILILVFGAHNAMAMSWMNWFKSKNSLSADQTKAVGVVSAMTLGATCLYHRKIIGRWLFGDSAQLKQDNDRLTARIRELESGSAATTQNNSKEFAARASRVIDESFVRAMVDKSVSQSLRNANIAKRADNAVSRALGKKSVVSVTQVDKLIAEHLVIMLNSLKYVQHAEHEEVQKRIAALEAATNVLALQVQRFEIIRPN